MTLQLVARPPARLPGVRQSTAPWNAATAFMSMQTRPFHLLVFLVSVHWLVASTTNAQTANAPTSEHTQEEFYDPSTVQGVRLQIAEHDLRKMKDALPKRIFVPGVFRWKDIQLQNVGVRYKGNSSSQKNQRHKRSFLIKFDKYQDEQRFLGLERVSLDNGIQFGSLFSEPIITEILRELDVPTHRSNFAKLHLNGKYHGVYVNVERIDQTFIANHLPDRNGGLFKVDEGGPGCNLQFLGKESTPYEKTFEAKNSTAQQSFARLIEWIRTINRPDDTDVADLEANFDIDGFLRVTAVMLYSGAFDQLTGWQPHNYYLFLDSKQDRWHYLPWDLDCGFSTNAFGRIKVVDDWHAAWPIPTTGQPSPLLERMISDPKLLNRYRVVARDILVKYFEPERLCAVLDAKYKLIKKDLTADPFPHRRITTPHEEDYDDIVGSMKQFVRTRYDSALEQLDNPGPRPKFVGPQSGHGAPPSIQKKIRSVEQEVRRKQQEMQSKIQQVQRLMQRVGPLLQQGKAEEADKTLDEALKRARGI